MKREYTEEDVIIGRRDLLEKWIQDRKKEKTLINVADIFLWEPLHRGKFTSKIPKNIKEVTGTIIVRPYRKEEGKYVLVSGWKYFHQAQKLKQEKINAYITHADRKRFAQKLLRYEEKTETTETEK